jgi:hypothetical protein
MSNNETFRDGVLREEREGEGSVYSGQRTGVIDAKPAVKIQSASASPGIAIAPRAVVQPGGGE